MNNEEKQRLDDVKFHRHHFIKTFFLICHPDIFTLYWKVTGSHDLLSPSDWNKFVNSKELHDFIYPRMNMISDFMLDAIAYSETVDNKGMEMHTDDCIIYIAMPLITHDNLQSIQDYTGARKQLATRCFITMLCHMFFKDLYGKPFRILKEKDGWFYLNDRYEYVRCE